MGIMTTDTRSTGARSLEPLETADCHGVIGMDALLLGLHMILYKMPYDLLFKPISIRSCYFDRALWSGSFNLCGMRAPMLVYAWIQNVLSMPL